MYDVVVLHSGGMDSTVALEVSAQSTRRSRVLSLTFDYGQRNLAEVSAAEKVARQLRVAHLAMKLPLAGAMRSPLLGSRPAKVQEKLPAEFVPARNLIFLSIAAGVAMSHGACLLATGINSSTDSPEQYPDCTWGFLALMQAVIREGVGEGLRVVSPVGDVQSRSEMWALADELGILEVVRRMTVSCYGRSATKGHLWGRGCGKCPPCLARQRGYESFLEKRKRA